MYREPMTHIQAREAERIRANFRRRAISLAKDRIRQDAQRVERMEALEGTGESLTAVVFKSPKKVPADERCIHCKGRFPVDTCFVCGQEKPLAAL
jgi:hypothetical protein